MAFSAEGMIQSWLSYHGKAEIYACPFVSRAYKDEYPLGSQSFFSHVTATAVWHLTGTALLSTGCKLTYGNYPFGSQWHLMPTIDFLKWIE